jgi:UDP-N-acetylglucosamine:LPS N-acetylglucosamine transferase
VKGPRRVLLVGSSGGHLAQLMSLQSWWRARERHWVTFPTADARDLLADEQVTWAYHPTTRSPKNLVRNLWLAIRTVRRLRPDLVVSTGAGVALPFFVVARLFGSRTAYIEVFDRMDSLTLTARLCRPFTDLLCAQWEEQRLFMPDSEVIGRLL